MEPLLTFATSLVMAKSNLAPLRPTTIFRNELNVALSAARLSCTLIDELRIDIASHLLD